MHLYPTQELIYNALKKAGNAGILSSELIEGLCLTKVNTMTSICNLRLKLRREGKEKILSEYGRRCVVRYRLVPLQQDDENVLGMSKEVYRNVGG